MAQLSFSARPPTTGMTQRLLPKALTMPMIMKTTAVRPTSMMRIMLRQLTIGTMSRMPRTDHLCPLVRNALRDRALCFRSLSSTATGSTTVEIDGAMVTAEAMLSRELLNSTTASVSVEGLPAGEYASHVHNSSCDLNEGSGHYQYEVGGPVDETNELWPNVTINEEGVGGGEATVEGHIARPEATSIVVHVGDQRICIPLSFE